jgi:hypothetical protein
MSPDSIAANISTVSGSVLSPSAGAADSAATKTDAKQPITAANTTRDRPPERRILNDMETSSLNMDSRRRGATQTAPPRHHRLPARQQVSAKLLP